MDDELFDEMDDELIDEMDDEVFDMDDEFSANKFDIFDTGEGGVSGMRRFRLNRLRLVLNTCEGGVSGTTTEDHCDARKSAMF